MRFIIFLSLIFAFLHITSSKINSYQISKINTNLSISEFSVADFDIEKDDSIPAVLVILLPSAESFIPKQILIQRPILAIIKDLNPSLNSLYRALPPPAQIA